MWSERPPPLAVSRRLLSEEISESFARTLRYMNHRFCTILPCRRLGASHGGSYASIPMRDIRPGVIRVFCIDEEMFERVVTLVFIADLRFPRGTSLIVPDFTD